jgi:hypothetical protein
MTARRPTGRVWAYIGAGLGGAVSVAANVAHSYVPPTPPKDASADWAETWSPHAGAVVGAVFWPVALFVAVEIFARICWPDGKRWTALRFLGLLPVAVVAAVVSYRHLTGLMVFYSEDRLTATIGPLAVDGLMVMATGALIATSTRRTVAALPAVVTEATTTVEPAPDPTPVTELATATPATEPADVPPQPAPTAARPAPKPAPVKRAPKRQPSTAERVAKAAARTPNATPAQIAVRLNVSERTVQRHWPRPVGPTPLPTAA